VDEGTFIRFNRNDGLNGIEKRDVGLLSCNSTHTLSVACNGKVVCHVPQQVTIEKRVNYPEGFFPEEVERELSRFAFICPVTG